MKSATHNAKMLERREECDSYLTLVCKHRCSGEKIKGVSANTVAFISCTCRLKVLYILSFHQVLRTPVMFTDVSKIEITLFPSF